MENPIAPVHRYSSQLDLFKNRNDAQSLYQNNSALVVDDSGISYDKDFFSVVEMPEKHKKIGSRNGVTLTPFVLKNGDLVRNPDNSLSGIIKKDSFLSKLAYEFRNIEVQLQKFVRTMFPGVKPAGSYNCTFRLVPTRSEGLHFDYFAEGSAMDNSVPKTRVKIFLNLDAVDRVWRVGPTLPDFLKISRSVLPDVLPADLNTLNYLIDRIGYAERCAGVEVHIPPGGVVIANGATVAHEIVYGNRMAAIEVVGENTAFVNGFEGERRASEHWMKTAGYELSTNFDGILKSLEGVPSGLDRAKERLLATA